MSNNKTTAPLDLAQTIAMVIARDGFPEPVAQLEVSAGGKNVGTAPRHLQHLLFYRTQLFEEIENNLQHLPNKEQLETLAALRGIDYIFWESLVQHFPSEFNRTFEIGADYTVYTFPIEQVSTAEPQTATDTPCSP